MKTSKIKNKINFIDWLNNLKLYNNIVLNKTLILMNSYMTIIKLLILALLSLDLASCGVY